MPRKPATAAAKTPEEIAAAKAEKRAKFLEIAPGRVSRTLSSINLLGNLGGAAYDYEPEYATQIVAALRRAVDGVEASLNHTSKAKPTFQFETKDAAAETPSPTP